MNEISFSNWQTFAIIIFNETKFQKKKKEKLDPISSWRFERKESMKRAEIKK